MSRPSVDLAGAAGAARSRAARPSPGAARGAISWVGLLMLLGLVGGIYLAWIWVPLYVDHYAVRQVVRDHMNQAVKNRDDAQLVTDMIRKIRSLVQVEGTDEFGRVARVPAVTLDDRDIVWDRTAGPPPELHVAFSYEREIFYPFLKRTTIKVFSVDETNDLTIPDWGPAR